MAGELQSSTHPPLPPTEEEDRFNWLRLLRSRRVGITTFWRMMAEFGTAKAALEALPGIAKAAGVEDYSICPEAVVAAELRAGRTHGAQLICFGEHNYPTDLADIDEAPPLLWCLGRTTLLERPMVALVGARNASSLGTRMARKLAQELSEEGYLVVSGLARGIDAAAHKAALPYGTVAVMAGGVNVIYPTENTDLAHEIAESGVRVSEQPIGIEPRARHFPTRNRIISGLARAVVVVEGAAKSGSLITARTALDQGRDVLAVPGHPFDGRASGCNMLLRDGAVLVRNGADVLEHIGPAIAQPTAVPELPLDHDEPAALATAVPTTAPHRRWQDQTALHSEILARLGPSPVAEDQLIRDLEVPTAAVTPALVTLELEGQIVRQAGGLLSKAS